jgi:serine protease Do
MRGFNEVVEKVRRSTVLISDGRGAGSGIVWNRSGSVLTNSHVAHGDELTLTDYQGRRLRGSVTRRDSESDMALVETGTSNLIPADIGDSDRIRPGEIAIAIGNPLGATGAAAWGIIHSIGPFEIGSRRTWIQADLRLAPGNSGGPLVTASGQVIGMNTMVYQGLGLAAPANEAAAFAHGETERVHLGVELMGTREGLIVLRIEPDSLAERAGLVTGDVLQCSAAELRRLLGGVKRFGSADIPVSRAGRLRMLRVHTRSAAGARAA